MVTTWARVQGLLGLKVFSLVPLTNPFRTAQVVTILWNAAGCPELDDYTNPFTDVKESDYFFVPVLWAVQGGLTSGVTETAFGPEQPCTRAQAMKFLHIFALEPGAKAEMPFTDVAEQDWFYDAVKWAVANRLTAGTSATTFGPDDTCTRAHLVTFLYHFMDKTSES